MLKIVFILFFLSITVFGSADMLVLTGKHLAFSLDDKTGHFFLENPNPRSRSFKDLLFRDNPPTSYLTVIIDNKPYRLSELKQETPYRVEGNSIRADFSQSKLTLKVIYFLTNLAGAENDSLLAVISVKNPTMNQVGTGGRFLLDTTYGESTKYPGVFSDGGERIEYDRLLRKENMPVFLLSGFKEQDSADFGLGLFIYPVINELKPSTILIGNWKKLDEKELGYTLDPLAKFRYNQFSNPDAAVAVFYQDVFIKTGEEIAFGVAMSTARLPIPGAVFYPAMTYFIPEIPGMFKPVVTAEAPVTAVSNQSQQAPVISNVKQTEGVTSAQVVVVTNDMYSAQRELLDKLSILIDKLNVDGTGPKVENSATNVKTSSSFRKGLDRSLTGGVPGDPFADEKYFRGAQAQAPAERVEEKQQYSSIRPVERSEPYVSEPRYAAPPMFTTTNVMVTNIMEGVDPRELDRLKKDQGKLQEEYSGKLSELEEYYKKLLVKQENEFKSLSSDYKTKMDEKDKKKSRNQKMEQIDQTIQDIDRKVEAMEAMLKLNLDFAGMPPAQLEEMRKALETLEKTLPK